MLESHPPRSPGLIFTIALAAGILLLDVLVALTLVSRPVTLVSFGLGALLLLSMPALVLTAYLFRGLRQARYRIDQGYLIIDWPGFQERAPLAEIQQILWGAEAETLRGFRGLRLPGLVLGRAEVVVDGRSFPATIRAARGLADQVLLLTGGRLLALSPVDPENFKACVQGLRGSESVPTPAVPAELTPEQAQSELPAGFWRRDRRALGLLLLPILLNIGLFAYLSAVFPTLPELVPLRLGPGDQVLRAGTPLQLFWIPLLALFGWLLNGGLGWYFYRWRVAPATGYLLWAASFGLQIAAWIGLIGLVRF
jgi:hypothetical protein